MDQNWRVRRAPGSTKDSPWLRRRARGTTLGSWPVDLSLVPCARTWGLRLCCSGCGRWCAAKRREAPHGGLSAIGRVALMLRAGLPPSRLLHHAICACDGLDGRGEPRSVACDATKAAVLSVVLLRQVSTNSTTSGCLKERWRVFPATFAQDHIPLDGHVVVVGQGNPLELYLLNSHGRSITSPEIHPTRAGLAAHPDQARGRIFLHLPGAIPQRTLRIAQPELTSLAGASPESARNGRPLPADSLPFAII